MRSLMSARGIRWADSKRAILLSVAIASLASGRIASAEDELPTPAKEREAKQLDAWILAIQSEDDATRMEARLSAGKFGARGVQPLARVLLEGGREQRITARHALTRLVHHTGRPGAESERPAVLRELEKLTVSGQGAEVRRTAVWLMGFIGGDETSAKVCESLVFDEDEHVAENARLVLERMPGDKALQYLDRAVIRASDRLRPALIFSLAKKGDPRAAGRLIELSGALDPAVRFAALSGLAHLGAPAGKSVLVEAVESSREPDRTRLLNEVLRLADKLRDATDDTGAGELYELTLKTASADFQRERALHQLAPKGDVRGLTRLLAALDDPAERVRRLALRRVASLPGAGVTASLLRSYEESDPGNRPVLLRALAARDRSAAERSIELAAESEDAELRITALDLLDRLDQPDLEGQFLEVAQNGSAALRPVALRGYLTIAEGRLARDEKAAALAQFRRALAVASDSSLRRRALGGLQKLGDPAALPDLSAWLGDSDLAVDAAMTVLGLARKLGDEGQPDAAEAALLPIARGSFPASVRKEAADQLVKMGRDPQRQVRQAGFVVNWWLTGPIEDADGKGIETAFDPELRIEKGVDVELQKIWRIGARRFRWKRLSDLCLEGVVSLVTQFRRSQHRVAYAYCELSSETALDALFKIGSDDGVACWLNGERVWLHAVRRELKIDEDVVPVRLRAGENRVLLKISQATDSWGFSLRVTDREGQPIVFESVGPE